MWEQKWIESEETYGVKLSGSSFIGLYLVSEEKGDVEDHGQAPGLGHLGTSVSYTETQKDSQH